MRCLTLAILCLLAHAADTPLSFEVASIKPFTPPRTGGYGGCSGGPGAKDPGQIACNGATLKMLVTRAYGIPAYLLSGPAWLDSERFAITAKVPMGTTKEQVLIMWQRLLADRFHLQVHKETREVPTYELSVAKNGPKLKDAAPELPAPEGATPPPAGPPAPLRMGPDGFAILPTPPGHFGSQLSSGGGRTKMLVRNETMAHFAMMLSSVAQRPVVDKTELTGAYDFTLLFAQEGADNDLPSLPVAVQEQLGLKLESKKGPAEMVVIDRVEKTPSEN